MSGNATNQDLTAWSVDNFRFAEDPFRVLAHNGRLSTLPNDELLESEQSACRCGESPSRKFRP